MARVLVTRPVPDNARTAQALRARGHEPILAPVLEMHPVADVDLRGDWTGVIVTSANALRALDAHPHLHVLRALPLFAVGEVTAAEAKAAGFTRIITGSGDAQALQELIAGDVTRGARLLYLAGVQVSQDVAGALRARGIETETRVVYRMDDVAPWPPADARAVLVGGFDGALHFSARSARTLCQAARAARIDASAAAHACLSEQVAHVLREAGFLRIALAAAPDETALLDALDRLLARPPGSAV